MALLIGFALLAGGGTALSPCVLPVLPALLSAGGAGGRRRPLGIVIGLTITFTVTIVGIASVVGGIGLGSDPLRDIAVAVLLLAGVMLIVPRLADRVEAPLSRLAALGPRTSGQGFWSGLLVGAALGFVYTPCAGPILAAVISIGAASGRSVVVGIAYAVGSAIVLLALMLGGRALFDRVRRAGRGLVLQRVLGAVMVLTAVAIIANLDVNFDQWVAQNIPNVNLTAGLEKSHSVQTRLADIQGHKQRFDFVGHWGAVPAKADQGHLLSIAKKLKGMGRAPEFTDTEQWFNTPGDRPLKLSQLGRQGKVVLIDFWTYTCINCIRTLPFLESWQRQFGKDGFTVVGVETPEFPFEREASNVKQAIGKFGINYPVVQDNEMGTWNAYQNEYWPADYLIDPRGRLRYVTFGEGEYDRTETAIRALLAESGHEVGSHGERPKGAILPNTEYDSPETYLGTERAEGWINGPRGGLHDYGAGAKGRRLKRNQFAFSGTWNIAGQPALAVSHAGIEAEFDARYVYLVLSSKGNRPRQVSVSLDGHPIRASEAGEDVHDGKVTVSQERLYTLVHLPKVGEHRLRLSLAPGVTGYSFTFG